MQAKQKDEVEMEQEPIFTEPPDKPKKTIIVAIVVLSVIAIVSITISIFMVVDKMSNREGNDSDTSENGAQNGDEEEESGESSQGSNSGSGNNSATTVSDAEAIRIGKKLWKAAIDNYFGSISRTIERSCFANGHSVDDVMVDGALIGRPVNSFGYREPYSRVPESNCVNQTLTPLVDSAKQIFTDNGMIGLTAYIDQRLIFFENNYYIWVCRRTCFGMINDPQLKVTAKTQDSVTFSVSYPEDTIMGGPAGTYEDPFIIKNINGTWKIEELVYVGD